MRPWRVNCGYLPSSPFLGALAYIRERRVGLSVYLDDPEVSIDTNHLERALRVIPMEKGTGCSAGLSWARSISALCKACWPPAGCTTSTRTITSWTCCSVSASTRPPWRISSRHGFGKRCLPRIRYAQTCMTLAADLLMPSRDRLLSVNYFPAWVRTSRLLVQFSSQGHARIFFLSDYL